MRRATLAIDGASKGNPGPAGIGVVIYDESGNVVCEYGQHIGDTTNNFAEYTALVRGLQEVLKMGFEHVVIRSDSELLVRQLSGQYKVRSKNLLRIYKSALELLEKFKYVSINHVCREANARADKLASQAASGEKPAATSGKVTTKTRKGGSKSA